MKKTIIGILLFLITGLNSFAITDMPIEVRDAAGDYDTWTNVEAGLDEDITAATVKVFSFDANSGTIADGASVSTDAEGTTGTCVHQSINGQILIKAIAGGTFDDNDVVTDGSNTVTLSDSGDSAGITVTFYDDFTAGGWSGGVYDDTNYLIIQGDTTGESEGAWDGTITGGVLATASGSCGFAEHDAGIQVKNLVINCDSQLCFCFKNLDNTGHGDVNDVILNGGGFSNFNQAEGGPVTLINCASINSAGACVDTYYNDADLHVYNFTCVNPTTYCYRERYYHIEAYNSICFNPGDGYDGYWANSGYIAGDYNVSSDDTTPGSHSHDNVVMTNELVDGANGDFHLKQGSILSRWGYDYSVTTGSTADIDRDVRAVPFSIGVDELNFVSEADTTAPTISNPLPVDNVAAHTLEVEISVDTDENSYCRYSTTADTAIEDMEYGFTTTYGTDHATTATGIITAATETENLFYVRCLDYNDNPTLSDTIVTVTVDADETAPSQIDDLAITDCDATSCDLSWTAVGDDGDLLTADSYDVRYYGVEITADNWSSATQAVGEPDPSAPSSAETFTVTGSAIDGLNPDTTYYFAIRALDIAGNIGITSNSTSGVTDDVAEDYIKVWVNNGSEKITQDEMRLVDSEDITNYNYDGTTVSIFGAKNEVVSFQTIIEVPDKTVDLVTIEFDTLTKGADTIKNTVVASGNTVFDYIGRPIENFYIRYLQIKGMSELNSGPCKFGYDDRACYTDMERPDDDGDFDYLDLCSDDEECSGGDSKYWSDRPNADKYYPDITIPIELEQPFTAIKNKNQAIWTDIYIPDDAVAGTYTGNYLIKIDGVTYKTIPIELEVKDFALPDEFEAKSWTWINKEDIFSRFIDTRHPEWEHAGSGAWEYRDLAIEAYQNLYRLFKRHHMDMTFDDGDDLLDAFNENYYVEKGIYQDAFDGGMFATTKYDGPGVNEPVNIFSLETYGFVTGDFLDDYKIVNVSTATGIIPDDTACVIDGDNGTCLHHGAGTYTDENGYPITIQDGQILVKDGRIWYSIGLGDTITGNGETLTVGNPFEIYDISRWNLDGMIDSWSSCTTDGGTTTFDMVSQGGGSIMITNLSGGTIDDEDVVTDGVISIAIDDDDGATNRCAYTIPMSAGLIQNYSDIYETWFKANYPDVERFIYLNDEASAKSDLLYFGREAQWVKENEGTGQTMKTLLTQKLSARQDYMPYLDIAFIRPHITSVQEAANAWAVANDRDIWHYNGSRPTEGTFVIEDDGISNFVNEWGAYKLGASRTFWWCGNCWQNYSVYYLRPGKETDVFETAQTFGTYYYDVGDDSPYDEMRYSATEICPSQSRGGCCKYKSNCGNGDGVIIYPSRDVLVLYNGFEGTGLADAEVGGFNTYVGDGNDYEVVIDGVSTPDTFKWNINDGAWTEGVAITAGSTQGLSNGAYIKFTSSTGHTLNDKWKIKTHRNYGLDGFFASVRLKLWRNALQQREYLYLAADVDSDAVDTLVDTMVPKYSYEHNVASESDPSYWYGAPSWTNDIDTWEAAREDLTYIITGEPDPTPDPGPTTVTITGSANIKKFRSTE